MESSKTDNIECLKVANSIHSPGLVKIENTAAIEMSTKLIKASLVKNFRDNRPSDKLLPYDQLKHLLTTFTVCSKEKAQCMIGGHFNNNQRLTEHLASRSLIGLDIDEYPGTIEQLKSLLQRDLGKYQYLAHSTNSHTPEKPSVRIVLLLAKEVETVKFNLIANNFVNTLSEELRKSLDLHATTTPNQLMTLPIIPHSEYKKWTYENEGESVTPDYTPGNFDNKSTVDGEKHEPVLHLITNTPKNYTDQQIWYYLDRYPIEDRDYYDWLEVGFALHHQYSGKVKGLKIWDKWSATDPSRYKGIDDLKSRWCGFSLDTQNPVTFASVSRKVNKLIEEYRETQPAKGDLPVQFYKWVDTQGKRALSTLPNFMVLLNEYNISLKFDAIRKVVIYNFDGKILEDNTRADTRFTSLFERNNLKVAVIPKYVHDVAKENTFNRWKDWITGKAWDRIDRFENFCASLTVEPEYESIKRTYLKKWLIQMLHMTCLNDGERAKSARMVLTFKGQQGIGKTTWITTLAPANMSDLICTGLSVDISKDQQVYKCMQHVIVELGELAYTLKKSDAEGFKNFITKSVDPIDHKYDKYLAYYRRTTVFFATTNDERFLGDTTGNSRFLVLPVLKCDAYHGIDMQQLYAQLMEEAIRITDYNLSAEEREEQDRINMESEHIEPLDDAYITKCDIEREPSELCNATQMLERLEVSLAHAANKKTLVDRMAKVLDKYCKRRNKSPKGWWIHPEKSNFKDPLL